MSLLLPEIFKLDSARSGSFLLCVAPCFIANLRATNFFTLIISCFGCAHASASLRTCDDSIDSLNCIDDSDVPNRRRALDLDDGDELQNSPDRLKSRFHTYSTFAILVLKMLPFAFPREPC